MSAPVTAVFRLATLPVRRCADLRLATRALRSAARSARGLKGAGAKFPAEVLGSDLVALLSKQIQERIHAATGSPEEAAYAREVRRVFAAAAPERAAPRSWAPDGVDSAERLRFAAAGRAGGASLAPTPPPGVARPTAPREPLAAFEPAAPAGTASQLAPPVSEADDSPFDSPEAVRRRADVSAGPVSLMEKKLREYWQAERGRAQGHTASTTAAAPVRPERQSAGSIPGSAGAGDATPRFDAAVAAERLASFVSGQAAPAPRPVAAPRLPGEPPLARPLAPVQAIRPGQATFAERLQSFVSGRGEPREHTAAAAWGRPEEPGFPSPRFASETGAAAGTPLAGELASRLAETLYAQAIQHGIDLT